MKWILAIIVVLTVMTLFKLQAGTFVAEATAREYLKAGAPVIDVRSADEFKAGHLPHAINIPLDGIKTNLPPRFPDKGQVLLLHCHSGRRSGMAETELKSLGYTNVFNLGGYDRAQAIVGKTEKK
ncbi:MAG TPA: rhodanese-like domain-containing protein [Dongiaceae bacterium]|nr:rhodanese-like domain-containing protein [Dongiaceae bacterium]